MDQSGLCVRAATDLKNPSVATPPQAGRRATQIDSATLQNPRNRQKKLVLTLHNVMAHLLLKGLQRNNVVLNGDQTSIIKEEQTMKVFTLRTTLLIVSIVLGGSSSIAAATDTANSDTPSDKVETPTDKNDKPVNQWVPSTAVDLSFELMPLRLIPAWGFNNDFSVTKDGGMSNRGAFGLKGGIEADLFDHVTGLFNASISASALSKNSTDHMEEKENAGERKLGARSAVTIRTEVGARYYILENKTGWHVDARLGSGVTSVSFANEHTKDKMQATATEYEESVYVGYRYEIEKKYFLRGAVGLSARQIAKYNYVNMSDKDHSELDETAEKDQAKRDFEAVNNKFQTPLSLEFSAGMVF